MSDRIPNQLPEGQSNDLPPTLLPGLEALVDHILTMAGNDARAGNIPGEEIPGTLTMSGIANGMRIVLQIMLDERGELLDELLEWHRRSPPFEIRI